MLMFGVPNLGLDNRAILAMTHGQKNNMLALNLGIESLYLPELDKEFSRTTKERNIQIVTICELLDSPSVIVSVQAWKEMFPIIYTTDQSIKTSGKSHIGGKRKSPDGLVQAQKSAWLPETLHGRAATRSSDYRPTPTTRIL
jgi:hypothetical protein